MLTSPVVRGRNPAEGNHVATAIQSESTPCRLRSRGERGTPMRIARTVFVSAAIAAAVALSAPAYAMTAAEPWASTDGTSYGSDDHGKEEQGKEEQGKEEQGKE